MKGRRILYAISNDGIRSVPLYAGSIFGEHLLRGRESGGRWRRPPQILPTNGFAQSLAFPPSSFSANSYPARNLQLRMLRAYMSTRVLYLCASRLRVTAFIERRIKSDGFSEIARIVVFYIALNAAARSRVFARYRPIENDNCPKLSELFIASLFLSLPLRLSRSS